MMLKSLSKVDCPPEWIQQFSDEIDRLEFGSGFARIGDETPWSFGVETGVGVASLKAFFHKIDDPVNSRHSLLECWSGPELHIVRGSAHVELKDGRAPAIDVPFVWIFYMDARDPKLLERIYIVNGPVKTDAVL